MFYTQTLLPHQRPVMTQCLLEHTHGQYTMIQLFALLDYHIQGTPQSTNETRLITMRSKPNYFEVAFILLFFCLALLIFLSLDKCHCDSPDVAGTNFAWTNVTAIVGIYSR